MLKQCMHVIDPIVNDSSMHRFLCLNIEKRSVATSVFITTLMLNVVKRLKSHCSQ